MIWKELVKIALLGTDRTQLSEELTSQLEEWGVDIAEAPERLVLEAAAIASPMQKAGTALNKWEAPFPSPSDLETRTATGKILPTLLAQIKQWDNEALLEDFIYLLQHSQKQIPSEFLPFLIEKASKKPSFFKSLEPLLGTKGQWLLQQHPDWQKLLEMPPANYWSSGQKDKRIALLENLRQQDPQAGLDLLRSTWADETPSDKARFLKILIDQLALEDEAFLEECLDDRRKEVRTVAANLLSHLPESLLVQRMQKRLSEWITIKKNRSLTFEIEFPEVLEKDIIRDGINPKLQLPKGGVKASRLQQMVACIPPDYWCSFFDASPADLIAVFFKNDWGMVFVQGIINALEKHYSFEWQAALSKLWIIDAGHFFWEDIRIEPLLKNIPADLFNQLCLTGLRKSQESINEKDPLSYLLQIKGQRYSNEVSSLVSSKLQVWIASEGYGFSLTPHYKNILHQAAYSIQPLLFDKVRVSWMQSSRYWPGWEREVQLFLATLGFRKKMMQELKT